MGKGQAALFIIIGLILVIIVAAYIFSKPPIKNDSMADYVVLSRQSSEIKQYMEQCMHEAGTKGILNFLGPQGGYVDPEGNVTYGVYSSVEFSRLSGAKVPYYYRNGQLSIRPIEDIQREFANYVLIESEKCFKSQDWKSLGITLSTQDLNYDALHFDLSKTLVNISVIFTDYDTKVDMVYPVVITAGKSTKVEDEFSTTIPIGYKKSYEIGKNALENAIAKQPKYFDISADCDKFTGDGLTNLYYLNNKFFQVFDYDTWNSPERQTFKFQFAVEGIKAIGWCPEDAK